MIDSAFTMAAFIRVMSASTWAFKARNSGETFLAALRLPTGAPTLPVFRGASFLRLPADAAAREAD